MIDPIDIVLLLIGLAMLIGLCAVAWFLFRSKFNKDGSIESSTFKSHAVIHHDSYGALVWLKTIPYAANFSYALIQCADEDGNAVSFTAYASELVEINPIQNAMSSHAVYRYTPDQSKMAAIRDEVNRKHSSAAVASRAKERAQESERDLKLANKNRKADVSYMMEEMAKMQKAQTPPNQGAHR